MFTVSCARIETIIAMPHSVTTTLQIADNQLGNDECIDEETSKEIVRKLFYIEGVHEDPVADGLRVAGREAGTGHEAVAVVVGGLDAVTAGCGGLVLVRRGGERAVRQDLVHGAAPSPVVGGEEPPAGAVRREVAREVGVLVLRGASVALGGGYRAELPQRAAPGLDGE